MDANFILRVLFILYSISRSVSEMECGRLEDPLNGRVDVETYRVGGIARYTCNEGYIIQGHNTALCMSNGEFEPNYPPVCAAVMCAEVRYFRNGYIEHTNHGRQSYSYRTTNTYHCNPGFEIVGRPVRQCQGTGDWSGDEPFCKEIICAPLGPLINGKIDYSERRRSWGTVAIFACNVNSDPFPDTEMAVCEYTGEWSDSVPRCLKQATVNPVTRGYVYIGRNNSPLRRRVSVKHGTTVRQTCNSRSELYSTENSRYIDNDNVKSVNYDGTWTPPLPQCVVKRCNLRETKYERYTFTFTNGTHAPAKVDHNSELLGRCITNYEFEDDEYDDKPASFTCKNGNIQLWQRCVPAFCSASLETGMYLDEGTSEIVADIGRIRHGTRVFYRCANKRDYELFLDDYTDSVSDKCSYGQWIKNVRPICKEKRCYLNVYEGALFSDENTNIIDTSKYIESGKSIHISCGSGFRMANEKGDPVSNAPSGRYLKCSKGIWSKTLKCKPEQCYLQVYDGATFVDISNNLPVESSTNIESGTSIQITCSRGFMLVNKEKKSVTHAPFSRCSKGKWSKGLKCMPAPCKFVKHEGSDFWLMKDGRKQIIDESGNIPSNTTVYISCHTGYRLMLTRGKPVPGKRRKYSECLKGNWSRVYECELVRTESIDTTTKGVSQRFFPTSALTLNTSETTLTTESQQEARNKSETTSDPGETTRQVENTSEMTTESEGTSEYTTLQSDGTEFDDYESGFVTASSQTDANEKETMEYYNGTIHQDNKNCTLPIRLNAEVYQMTEGYLPGDKVPHGYSFGISCWADYEVVMGNVTVTCDNGKWYNMPDCEEDSGSDGLTDCGIANGQARRENLNPSLYNVSCSHGYHLNFDADFFTCQNGHFYPFRNGYIMNPSSEQQVRCLPENCPLPYTMPSSMKVKNRNGTYYSGGSSISHKEKIIVSCSEGFEPYDREFKCYAGELRPVSNEWKSETYIHGTLECRKANCDPSCVSGICIADDECRCDEGHYGIYCEKAFCSLPNGVQHRPYKAFYTDETKLYGISCADPNAKYRGPSPLECLSAGTWNGHPTCVLTSTDYYLHFVIDHRYKVTRQQEERIINLYGDGFQTTDALLKYSAAYREKNDRIYIFKFQAEEVDHVESISFTSPFQGSISIRKIKVELRNKAVVYSSPTAVPFLLEQGRVYPYQLTIKKAYNQTFEHQSGVLPFYYDSRFHDSRFRYWMPKMKRYNYVDYQLCETKCNQESAFTCAAIVYNSYHSTCTTLPYSGVDYPEYFVDVGLYQNIFMKLYARHYVASK